MNQDDVLVRLKKLHECKEPFKLNFSGKKSKSANGVYRPASREIVIHNLNFTDDGGRLNESALMYTAIHELAHHIQFTEFRQKGVRCHTKLFHSIMDGLADKAEEAGVYKPEIDGEIKELVREVKEISCAIANLQRDLGKVLAKLNEACVKKGVRYEDVVKRKARISVDTVNRVLMIAALDLPEGVGADVQEAIAKERNEEKRRIMSVTAQAGKSVAQVRQAGSSSSTQNKENEFDYLLKEKERLEMKIKMLQQRLRSIVEKINSDRGLRPPCASGG